VLGVDSEHLSEEMYCVGDHQHRSLYRSGSKRLLEVGVRMESRQERPLKSEILRGEEQDVARNTVLPQP
jgi:hypothetical protein